MDMVARVMLTFTSPVTNEVVTVIKDVDDRGLNDLLELLDIVGDEPAPPYACGLYKPDGHRAFNVECTDCADLNARV